MENYSWRCRLISSLENLTSPPTVTGLWRYGTLPSSGTPGSKPLKQGPKSSKGSSQMVEEESIGTKIRPSTPGTWNGYPLSGEIQKNVHMIIRPTTTLIASLTMTMEPGLQMPHTAIQVCPSWDWGRMRYVEQIPVTLTKIVELAHSKTLLL